MAANFYWRRASIGGRGTQLPSHPYSSQHGVYSEHPPLEKCAMNQKVAVWLFILFALGVVYSAAKRHSDSVVSNSRPDYVSTGASSAPSYESKPESSSGLTFDGDPCSGDCSGHEAGYRWAEEHSIDDEDDCDTAGETSNSPSFAQGCKAYVEGESDNVSSSDSDDDSDDTDDPD